MRCPMQSAEAGMMRCSVLRDEAGKTRNADTQRPGVLSADKQSSTLPRDKLRLVQHGVVGRKHTQCSVRLICRDCRPVDCR